MALTADSGGGYGGPGFNASSPYYEPGVVDTSCVAFRGSASGEGLFSALWSGGGGTRGAVENAMKAANPAGLTAKAGMWDSANTEVSGYAGTLGEVYSKLSAVWSGDDADQALQTLGGLYATLSDQVDHTSTMAATLRDMASDLSACKSAWGHDTSTLGGIGNWMTGSQDREAADDYNRMVSNFGTYLDRMPHQVPTQVKTTPSGATAIDDPITPGGSGPGGAPGVGGPGSSAHADDPAAAHIGTPGMAEPHVGGPRAEGPDYSGVHPPSSQLAGNGGEPAEPGIPPYGNGELPGGGVPPGGIPTGPGSVGVGAGGPIDGGAVGAAPVAPVGSQLAGFAPGAGAGIGAGAAPGVVPGGAVPGAAGAFGDSPGLGGGLMSGVAGGSGSAGGDETRETTVPGAGSGAAGVGAEGAGGTRGILPMRPGGSGDDEDERDRATWLVEEDDIWGGGEDVPSVIVS